MSKKPGNVWPTQAALVSVVRVASTIPRRPIATAHRRTLVGARGALGKLSVMPAAGGL
jgi:hypothetical protein